LSGRKFFIVKLKPNLLEIESKSQVIEGLPTKGLIEVPFIFKRNGICYFTYHHVQNKTERLK